MATSHTCKPLPNIRTNKVEIQYLTIDSIAFKIMPYENKNFTFDSGTWTFSKRL